MEKKPHKREENIVQGSVSAHKTDKVDTGSGKPVGAGGRPGAGSSRPSGSKPVPTPRRVSRAAGGGTSMLFIMVMLFLLMRSCGGATGVQSTPGQAQTATQAPIVTQAPVVTQAPTQAPTQVPAATQAPTAAPAVIAGTPRARFYTPKANDTVTVMVYMCGTDLESSYGMATSDLQEMASAKIGSNVNVIVETGGCKMWKNRIVSNSSNQIYKVESGGVRPLVTNLGKKPMVESATLTEFIRYCAENYPAQRNILILWDHGGGSISGYGYDELYKSAGSMDLAEISAALKDAGCTFDWIGFDACLMATMETAFVCGDYADYLLASEETEPGTGWYYTNWLNQLSQKTNIDTVTLGKKIIDDFVETSTKASARAQVSLSLVDLAEMQATVPAAFRSFSTSIVSKLANKDYAAVSTARAGARQFASSNRINQIDLVDFANRISTPEGQQLSQALRSCVKHNNTTISHAYGLSIYFPYESTGSVRTAVSTYNKVGMDEEYTKCITSFASLASGGQLTSAAGNYGSLNSGGSIDLGSLLGAYLGGGSSSGYGGSSGSYSSYSSPLGSLLGGSGYGGSSGSGSIDPAMVMQLLGALSGSRSLPAEMDWLDTDILADNAEYISENVIDPAEFVVSLKADGTRYMPLSDKQWEILQTIELNVFVDDGDGYIDLGLDNTGFDYDDEDNLLMTFNGTWLTVNRRLVAYYMTSDTEEDDGSWTTRGHIPAMLTQTLPAELPLAGEGGESSQGMTVTQFVYLEVVFDKANPKGVITGARPMYTDETEAAAKGDIQIKAGDELQFLCDYYNYDGSFESTYKLGEPLTVGADGLTLANMALDNDKISVTYRLTDFYGNHYWTPAWIY